MIEFAEKPKIRIGDDGESEHDLIVPRSTADEKRKRRSRRLWRAAPFVLVFIAVGFALGLLFTPISRFVAQITVYTSPHTAKVLYGIYGSTHAIDLATGQDDDYGKAMLLDPARPSISPDGTRLAFWKGSIVERVSELWITEVKSQASSRVGAYYVVYPKLAWSADSTQLAFAAINESAGPSASFESEELFIADAATGTPHQLTNNGYSDEQPSWSPDGKQLVYTSTEDGYHRLRIIDVSNGASHIVSTACFGYVPAWSPDGNMLAFMSNHEGSGNDQVYVINVDGSGLRRLTNNAYSKEGIAWEF